jgi:diaminopimelate decarboxylase
MEPDLTIWNLQRKSGRLHWNGCSLTELALHYGTPLFVVNTSQLEQSYREMLKAFQDEGLDAEIFFSFKTNPVPDVLKSLIQLGAGAEVISEFELWLAIKLGVEGNRIIANGSVKSRSLLRQAVEADAGLINVETPVELRSLQEIAAQLGMKANVGLRINPALKKRRFDFTTSTASSSCHIGFLPGSNELSKALKILREEPNLRFRGIHFHIGSGIRTAKPYEEALTSVFKVLEDMVHEGFNIEAFDIGGGFNIPTLKELNLWEAVRLFGLNKPPKSPVGTQNNLLREIARLCSRKLHDFAVRQDILLPKVYLEPGRALSASAQLLLLTVGAVRERGKDPAFALCDGGAMSISPLLLSEYHNILVANKTSNKQVRKYNIMGNLPTPLDVVSLQRELPPLSAGDVLAVMDVGAYFTSLGNNFAGPRPAIVMIENGTATLIRRRETFEDLASRDMRFSSLIK